MRMFPLLMLSKDAPIVTLHKADKRQHIKAAMCG